MVAFQEMYQKADTQYISEAEQKEDAVLMCCGTCAVGAYIEYAEKKSQVTELEKLSFKDLWVNDLKNIK